MYLKRPEGSKGKGIAENQAYRGNQVLFWYKQGDRRIWKRSCLN